MKKLCVFLLTLSLTFSFCACGSPPTAAEREQPSAAVRTVETANEDNLQLAAETAEDDLERAKLAEEAANVESVFAGLIDGASVKSQETDDRINVSIRSDYSPDQRPDDWDAVIDQMVAASEAVTTERLSGATIEAADGTILLTLANGKVMYDHYAGVTEPQHLDIKVGGDLSPSRSTLPAGEHAYVLNTNTMKFHKPTCSSVDKIADDNRRDFTGTRDEVIDMGYDPCGNCNP